MNMMNKDAPRFSFLTTNNFVEIMEESFKYWHDKYDESLINYPLVWKKALESDPEILQKIEEERKNSKQNTALMIEQFFEMWSCAIKESNFETAVKSIQSWQEFWRNLTGEQFKICCDILQMMEKYWKNIQIKNIE